MPERDEGAGNSTGARNATSALRSNASAANPTRNGANDQIGKPPLVRRLQ